MVRPPVVRRTRLTTLAVLLLMALVLAVVGGAWLHMRHLQRERAAMLERGLGGPPLSSAPAASSRLRGFDLRYAPPALRLPNAALQGRQGAGESAAERVALNDAVWREELARGAVHSIAAAADSSELAYAQKAVLLFRSGARAIAKVVARPPQPPSSVQAGGGGAAEPASARWSWWSPAWGPAALHKRLLRIDLNRTLPRHLVHLEIDTVSYQGAAELAAFHVDRVLRLYKKPFTIGRMLSQQELRAVAGRASVRWLAPLPPPQRELHEASWSPHVVSSASAMLRVSLQQWLPDVRPRPPTSLHFQYLTHARAVAELQSAQSRRLQREVGDISDVLVFDFLVDDHDRREPKNWLYAPSVASPPCRRQPRRSATSVGNATHLDSNAIDGQQPSELVIDHHDVDNPGAAVGDANNDDNDEDDECLGEWLTLDSGLAWKHGPFNRKRCTGILCDVTLRWELEERRRKQRGTNDTTPTSEFDEYECSRICVFRRTTYATLLELHHAPDRDQTLGGRVRERLRSEPLDPVFHFMQFEDADERFQDVSLVCSVDNFIDGLNERLATLVHHIEHCISLHGKDTVLAVP